MGYASNRELRRQRSRPLHSSRVLCTSCGAPIRPHSADLLFCDACRDWARQANLAEQDDLGAGD
jgi:hypothetical protein